MISREKIVICGKSCVTGAGYGLEAWLDSYEKNMSIPRMIDPSAFKTDIDIIQKGPRELHRTQKISAVTLLKALNDAGIDPETVNPGKISVFFGNTYGGEQFKSDFFEVFSESPPDLTSPSLFPYTTINSLSAGLSIIFGLTGTNITFSSGATSASEGILAASDLLLSGETDIAVVLGESFFTGIFSREFERCGFLNESVASLILMRENDAMNYGSNIYARIESIEHGFCPKEYDHNIWAVSGTDFNILNYGISLESGSSISESKKNIPDDGGKILPMEDLLGNTFSTSGIMGIILAILLLERKKVMNYDFGPGYLKKGMFFNKDSYGNFVKTIISGLDNEDC